MATGMDHILRELKNKIYRPVYFLAGEESYFIDTISDYIEEHVLDDTEKEFNQTVIYGKDTDIPNLVSIAKRYPMMANYQVVIVREAQDIQKIENLQSYLENPLDTTLLVINYKYKKVDRRRSFFKTVEKKGVLFESKKIYDNQLGPWISGFVKEKGYSITAKATAMLTEFLGTELSKVVNEIDKLIINLPEKTEINDAMVEKYIGISKDYNIFELQHAIGMRNIVKANRIVNYFGANPKENSVVKTIALLYGFFSKVLVYHSLKDKSKNNVASVLSVPPYFVQDYSQAARRYNRQKLTDIIGYLRTYDLKAKGVGNVSATDGELLKEMMYKILH